MKNNLFSYATSELSQDAFICWCVNWFNYGDDNHKLYNMAKEFITLVSGIDDITSVHIYRQYQKIDVLLILNEHVAIIIEDKTFTSEHDCQINRYEAKLQKIMNSETYIEIEGEKFSITTIKSVYLKTGNLYPGDEQNEKLNNLKLIKREHMLKIFEQYKDCSEIVYDFWEYLIYLDEWYAKYERFYKNGEYEKAFQQNYGQLVCMKDFFNGTKMLGEFSSQDVLITSGSSYGCPYTWAWIWGKENWYWLGYRLDRDNKGYFISLRQYRYYKKSDKKEKVIQEKNDMFVKMKDALIQFLDKTPLVYVLGGNNGGYCESEIGKFYFKDNNAVLLKQYLMPLATQVLRQAIPTYIDNNTAY